MNPPVSRSRREAVADLVHLRKELDEAIAALRGYPWDSDEELVDLGPAELRRVLESFLADAMTAEKLEQWANAVEGREDIHFRPLAVVDFVAELANPLLFGRLTQEAVMRLLDLLSAVDRGLE